MHVEAINIGSSDALGPAASVTAVAGKGIVGDRHFADHGARPGNALTLIEAEVLEDVGLTGSQSRRQVVVRGVRVNDLIGKRFRIGDVECVGVEICEPCLHLQRLTRPGIIKGLIHRGGLNADILSDGTISVGDQVLPDFSADRHTEPLSRRRASRGFVSASWQDLPQSRSQGGLLRGQGEPAAAAEAGEGAQAAARGAAVRVIAVRPVATAARDPAA